MPVGQAQEKPEGRGKQRWEQPPFLEPHLLEPGEARRMSQDSQPGFLQKAYKGPGLLCLALCCPK